METWTTTGGPLVVILTHTHVIPPGTMLARAPGVVAISKPSGISTEMLLESLLGSSWNKRVQTVSRQVMGKLQIAMTGKGPSFVRYQGWSSTTL